MYKALYRQFRPSTFEEMAGQKHIVKILKNQIQTGNIGHAYLFCGTRGTGKTSAARIFAKGVNCLSQGEKPCGVCENCESIQNGTFFDVIEIDAASNNGVESIRELRESVKYPPAAGLCKVYIIDEVHMLSQGAFNALLKTLEEPPSHVIFILATTEAHKLPATVLSRCLRLDFRRVPEQEIVDKLKEICKEIGIQAEDSGLALIAANGDGSVRDALSILEQCIPGSESGITRNTVVEILGTAGEAVFSRMTDMVNQKDAANALCLLDEMISQGKDIRQFIKDWIFYFRNLMMSKYTEKLETIINMSCENAEKVKTQGAMLELPFISNAMTELSKTSNEARWSTQPRILLELSIVKLSEPSISQDFTGILQRIKALENGMLFQGISETIKEPDAIKNPNSMSNDLINDIKLKKKEQATTIKQDSSQKIKAKPEMQTQPTDERCNKLWETIVGAAMREKPSFAMLKTGIVPISLNENEFVISTESDTKQAYLLREKTFLEELIHDSTQKKLKLTVFLAGSDNSNQDQQESGNHIMKKLEKLVGADKIKMI